MDTDEFIAATMRRVAASAHATPRTAPTPVPARRWFAPLVAAAAAAVVVLIVLAAGLLGSHRSGAAPAADGPSKSSNPRASTCSVDYPQKLLPRWARGGFSRPAGPVSYVLGDGGDMAAIVWDAHRPLTVPPTVGRTNKILWVARVGAAQGPLRIRATSASTGETVTRTVAGSPGPSSIDLPAAGCWSFDLTWGSHQDHLVLGYAPR
jgi:hypothetical protein